MPEVTTGYVKVPLTQGQVALVDEADAEAVMAHKWYAHKRPGGKFYAMRNVRQPGRPATTVYMHRELTGFAQVDHINGDRLDNRRSNLRAATARQNNFNRGAREGSSSRYKGITRRSDMRKPWRAQIRVDGKQVALGQYATEEEAARAYDAAARAEHGEFARLNFPNSA